MNYQKDKLIFKEKFREIDVAYPCCVAGYEIRKIEELQRKIVNYYFDYMSARSLLIKSDEIVAKRHKHYIEAQKMKDEQLLMIDSFYRS